MTMDGIQFKAHLIGTINRPSTGDGVGEALYVSSGQCSEAAVVKMIIEMLMGFGSELFSLTMTAKERPLCDLLQAATDADDAGEVFVLTFASTKLQLGSLSNGVLRKALEWFAALGSQVQLCRMAIADAGGGNESSYSDVSATGSTQQLSSLLHNKIQTALSDLIVAMQEKLCQLEAVLSKKVLGVGRSVALDYTMKVSLLQLYCQCRDWKPLFDSLVGLLATAVCASQATFPILHHAAAMEERGGSAKNSVGRLGMVSSKLALRGVMEEVALNSRIGVLSTDFDGYSHAKFSKSPHLFQRYQESSLWDDTHSAGSMTMKLPLCSMKSSSFCLFSKQLHTLLLHQYISNLCIIGLDCADSSAYTQIYAVDLLYFEKEKIQFYNKARASTEGRRWLRLSSSRLLLRNLDRISSMLRDGFTDVPGFLRYITQEALHSCSDLSVLHRSGNATRSSNGSADTFIPLRINRNKLLSDVRAFVEQYNMVSFAAFHQQRPVDGSYESAALFRRVESKARAQGYWCDEVSLSDPMNRFFNSGGKSIKVVGSISQQQNKHRSLLSRHSRRIFRRHEKPLSLLSSQQHQMQHYVSTRQPSQLFSNKTYFEQALLERDRMGRGSDEALALKESDEQLGGRVNRPCDDDLHVISQYELFYFSPDHVRLSLSLFHSLHVHLLEVRAAAATVIHHQHHLRKNINFIGDIFLLGNADFFSPLRDVCLFLSCAGPDSVDDRLDAERSMEMMLSCFSDTVRQRMLEALPSAGVRHIAVTLPSDVTSAVRNATTRRKVTVNEAGMSNDGTPSTGRATVFSVLRDYTLDTQTSPEPGTATRIMSPVATSSFSSPTGSAIVSRQINSFIESALSKKGTPGGQLPSDGIDEVLLSAIASRITVEMHLQWPLNQFFDSDDLLLLNDVMRFLLLLTICKWNADYWWKTVISNDELGSYSKSKHSQQQHVFNTMTEETRHRENEYFIEICAAKKVCRYALSRWQHAIAAVYNFLMHQVHSRVWSGLQQQLDTHSFSCFFIKQDIKRAILRLQRIINILKAPIIHVMSEGLEALRQLRAAMRGEADEITARAASREQLKLAINQRSSTVRSGAASFDLYATASGVVAYRAVENAFRQAGQAVAILQRVVNESCEKLTSMPIQTDGASFSSMAALQATEEVKALDELRLHLCA